METVLNNKSLIVITGPTASGKTSLSLKLAKKLNCDIISADSRQFYREMNIGTAKPTKKELDAVNHHFINNISIFDDYDVGMYKKEVEAFLENYFKNNNHIIITGGTGLYIEALIEGLNEFPDVEKDIIKNLEKIYSDKGIEALQDKLKKIDPDYFSKVDKNNHHRLIRAISVFEQSGIPYSAFLKKDKNKIKYKSINILLELPRKELYDRINTRVDEMILNGLEKEAKELFPHRNLKALNTVGYKELFKYFDGEITLEEAISLIKRNTRRYAKRQMTWFNNRGTWSKFSPFDFEGILAFVNKSLKPEVA